MTATAWMLSFAEDGHAAIGELELVHVLVDEPALSPVPGAPAHCRETFVWQQRALPLMDVRARLGGPRSERRHIAVVRWRDTVTGDVEHGGVALCAPPRRVAVEDEQQCVPADPAWRPFALSCFRHTDLGPVPIVALARIFSASTASP